MAQHDVFLPAPFPLFPFNYTAILRQLDPRGEKGESEFQRERYHGWTELFQEPARPCQRVLKGSAWCRCSPRVAPCRCYNNGLVFITRNPGNDKR